MNRGSWRYQRKERHEAALRERLRELAGERPRFGYRRLHRLLRREKQHGMVKWVVNHKRVYRLYREEGLAMHRRKGKRFRAEKRVPLVLPARANQMWTMDFTRDSLADGRKFRTLNLMDGYTREALYIEVDTSLPGLRVVQVLERVAQERGLPEAIQQRTRDYQSCRESELVHEPARCAANHRSGEPITTACGPTAVWDI